MATATKTGRKSTTRALAKAGWRDLLEFVAATRSPLKVDEDAGVIFRVKVLGRFSKNAHGQAGAENGSEYSRQCMESALPMYEGAKVKANHPLDRSKPAAERDVDETLGVLRNCVVEPDESGDPAVWADLHYLKAHTLAPRVVEDVKRGLGVYGLSHNAAAARERFDPATRRLVIESLALVRSVDLVDRPATNRNLWESERRPVTITLKSVLESRMSKLSKPRQLWARWLLEDDSVGLESPADMPAEGGNGEDELLAGFRSAVMAIFDGDGSAQEKAKKIGAYLKAHEKLTQEPEPEEESDAEVEEQVADGTSKNQAGQRRAMNAKDPDDHLTSTKLSSVEEAAELKAFRVKDKVRQLCESAGFAPDSLQLDAVCGLADDKKRRELIESFKGSGKPGGFRAPKSKSPIPPPKAGDNTKLESGVDAAAGFRTLMG